MKFIRIILIAITLLITSCEKTEHPWILGTWVVEEYLINGNDSTDAFKSNSCYEPINLIDEHENPSFAGTKDNGCSTGGIYFTEINKSEINFAFYKCSWRTIGFFGSLNPQKYKFTILSYLPFKMNLKLSKDSITEEIVLKKLE